MIAVWMAGYGSRDIYMRQRQLIYEREGSFA